MKSDIRKRQSVPQRQSVPSGPPRRSISTPPTPPKQPDKGRSRWRQFFARPLPRSRWVRVGIIALCVCLLLGSFASFALARNYTALYQRDATLAHQGAQHLETAQTLLKGLLNDPFNSQRIGQAKQAFTQSYAVFGQIAQDVNQIPSIATLTPHYGALLGSAQRVVPIAVELSQAGIIGCNALNLLSARFQNPLNAKGSGLTMADLATLDQDFAQVQQLFDAAVNQINHLQPSDLQLAPSLKSEMAAFRAALPSLQQGLASVKTLLAIAPTFLGVQQPTQYLIEVLDSTELRPGGGFIGNYGVLTLSGARVSNLFITDVDLLDRPFEFAGHTIAYPAAYRWFHLATSWSLRDSNLDADFATAARYAEQIYHTEGGTAPVQGVIALTPWLMQGVLNITGPITVPQYGETVTAANLVTEIHYHQLGDIAGPDYTPAPDGHSSLRKEFTELLFEQLFARVQQILPTHLSAFMQLFLHSMRTKDIQMYFNNPQAESLLQSYHAASTIASPPGDSFMVVDANITGNKANDFISYEMQDQVTLDTSGDAIHQLTLTYSWPASEASLENDYGNKYIYHDYVRVYVPPGSVLQSQQGWQPKGSSTAFGREVWAGLFSLNYGDTGTITLTWMAPHAAQKDASGWHYQFLAQRQAGITWYQTLQVNLPACARMVGSPSGLSAHSPQSASVSRSLTQDTTYALDYTCSA